MKFSLIICTYMRPNALLDLLNSVAVQTLYPNEILIIDGSLNSETEHILKQHPFKNLVYHNVDDQHRGLTKQRNFGISKVDPHSEVICFLDDDTKLNEAYFQEVITVFEKHNSVVGVGGVATNENRWQEVEKNRYYSKFKYYKLDGFVVEEGLRNRLRNYLYLQSEMLPNQMPEFSHGRTCGYPLNNKIYEVDLLIGMSFSFRASVFRYIQFSTYFEGYGLYEDADFSIRSQKYGKNVVVTSAKLEHFHDSGGRPNMYKYGKMVVRNGWYVWRLKYPNPHLIANLKWHLVHFLLFSIRLINVFTTTKRSEAINDAAGRFVGWLSLVFNKPKVIL